MKVTGGTIYGDVKLGANCVAPPDHSVTKKGRTFGVLPWRRPDDRTMGNDMIKEFDDNWIDIPAGWKLV
ncbi:unnamed protein product [Effrenium voratum]|nr:unnamed protein product [Effrenium voratum]